MQAGKFSTCKPCSVHFRVGYYQCKQVVQEGILSLLMDACDYSVTGSISDARNLSIGKISCLPEDTMRIAGKKVDADAG